MHNPSLPLEPGLSHAAGRPADAATHLPGHDVPHPRLTGCPACGTVQRLPHLAGWTIANCGVCRTVLERRTGRSRTAALACAAAALLLLLPSNLFPFLTTSILGVSRQSRLYSSAYSMFANGWPDLGIVVALFVIVFPTMRLGLLTAVLGVLETRRRPAWLGGAFRCAMRLEGWAMADVFVLALAVAYGKLVSQLSVVVEPGAICFIGVALLSLFVRATLDPGEVWRAIRPDAPATLLPPNARADVAAGGRNQAPPLTCTVCEMSVAASSSPSAREGGRCPRCAARLHARKPEALGRTVALTLAAVLLYFPANIYPIASIPNGLSTDKYTVVGGVIELWQTDLYGLAVLVVVASVVIPVLKLAGLFWCVASVLRRSKRHLIAKTRAFRVVEEIGRWSMVDPFVIACFVPVSQFNALVYGRAESAAPAFTAVVILTVIAARAFDSRLIWDAAAKRNVRP